MIYVANDKGSKEFLARLHRAGVPAELRDMPSADFAFAGNGPSGEPLAVGIERKTINELAIFRQNRLSRQAPRMVEYYERRYLVVEGHYTAHAKGDAVWQKKGRWVPMSPGWTNNVIPYAFIDNYLTSICEATNIHVKRTNHEIETVRVVVNLYNWWQKPYAEHARTLGFDPSLLPAPRAYENVTEEDKKQRLLAQMIEPLEGVGAGTAVLLSHRWKTPLEMVTSEADEWLVKKTIGPKRAEGIIQQLRGDDPAKEE